MKTYMIMNDGHIIANHMPLGTAVELLHTLATYAPSDIAAWELVVDYVEVNELRPQERKD